MSAPVLTTVAGGVAVITLNRPEKRNALNRETVALLITALHECAVDPAVRVVQITGSGTVFCAGADLAEMQTQIHSSEAANLADAEQLAAMLGLLDSLPKPTLARVNGDGYGGALGVLGACDIVVAAVEAKFAFTEVRLGIIPAVISPFVLAKIGQSAARRYFLSAELLNSTTLERLGLVHEAVPGDMLDATCARITEALMKGAPQALAAAKALISDVAHAAAAHRSAASTAAAARLAHLRTQAEAQEGFSAFFEKRKPSWRKD